MRGMKNVLPTFSHFSYRPREFNLRLLYDLLSVGMLPFSNRSKYSSEYPLYGILLLLRWWWWLFVVSSWSSREIAGKIKKNQRLNVNKVVCFFLVVNFGRLIKVRWSPTSLSSPTFLRKYYSDWSRLHKKSNLGEKVTSTWKARTDFKRRRGKEKPSLALFLSLRLNHHLVSNWKKVKSKNKIIVTRK